MDGSMKKLLAAMFVGLLMVGCGEEAQKEVVEGEGQEKAAQTETKDDPSLVPQNCLPVWIIFAGFLKNHGFLDGVRERIHLQGG